MAKEAHRDKAEIAKQKSKEVVLKKMVELEKAMAEGNASPEQEMQDMGGPTQGQT